MSKKLTVILAAVAVVLAAGAGVSFFVNSRSELPVDAQPEQSVTKPYSQQSQVQTTVQIDVQESENSELTLAPVPEGTVEVSQTQTSEQETTETESTTLLQTVTTVIDTVKNTVCTPTDISEHFVLPKAKKYISDYPDIDFASINLASYKYSDTGNYYYTDDKDCWQDNFGYSQVYDKLAVVGHMYYDTVRVEFVYDDREWLVQLWKGQYGYVFVGAEVGVYTRELGSVGTGYACADKEDWLYMEMTCFWDVYDENNYEPVFTRPYDKYWWCTGFVLGWLEHTRKCDELELVGRITFKDEAMAQAFCEAFEKKGFSRKTGYDFNSKDSFVKIGRDVAFVWLNIDE